MSDSLRDALIESRAALESMRMFVHVETPTATGTVKELERVLDVVKTALAAHPVEPARSADVGAACESRWHLVGPTRAQPACLECES